VKPPFDPIPVQRPFQILGVAITKGKPRSEASMFGLSRLVHKVANCISSARPEGNMFSGTTDQGGNSFVWGARSPVV